MNDNKEKLKQLIRDFQRETSIKVEGEIIRGPGDYALYFDNGLNAVQLHNISQFIIDKFSHRNDFAYLNPKLGVSVGGSLTLRFSESLFD